MPFISYLQIFSNYLYSTILFFSGQTFQYKSYSLVIAFVSVFALLRHIHKSGSRVTVLFMKVFFVFVLIIMEYWLITPLFYSFEARGYFSGELLALAGQVFPAVLCAIVIAYDVDIQQKIKKVSFLVSILFTVVSFSSVLNPISMTSGLLAAGYGMNYQTMSYMASYGACLAEYYILTFNKEKNHTGVKLFVAFGAVAINLISILLSGGRGGIVVFSISTIVFFHYYVKRKRNEGSAKSLIQIITIVPIIIFVIALSFSFAQRSNISTSGYNRIIDMFGGLSDTGRSVLRTRAFRSFLSSPIIGHGFGSVFYEIGQYSHNIFTDLLVETGIVGISIFLYAILRFLRGVKKLIQNDMSDSLWLFLFLMGFIQLLFSSYYCASVSMWWSIFFVIAKMEKMNYVIIEGNQ